MPNRTIIPETSAWVSSVYLLEVTDILQGYNPDTDEIGISNLQAQQLANRTAYLKYRFEIAHTEDGNHVLRDVDFTLGAAIEEAKLTLDYSTASLKADNIIDAAANVATENRILNVSGVEGSLIGALSKAVPLSWEYSDHGFEFELFSGDLILRDFTPINLIETIAGDESIDVADSSKLIVGRSYVIHDGTGGNSEFITIKEKLTGNRVLCDQIITRSRTSGKVACTSWTINANGTASARNNALFVSKPIKVGKNYENTRVIIRRESNTATLLVEYKKAGELTWKTCEFKESIQRLTGTRDEEYRAPGGTFELRIKVTCPVGVLNCAIHHICALPDATISFADPIRTPINVTPANEAINTGETPTLTGSTYLSLYNITQAGAEFQVARDENFADIVHSAVVESATTSYIMPAGHLQLNTAYFWRCRYKDADGTYSGWSVPSSFTTASTFSYVVTPITTAPAAGQSAVSNTGVVLMAGAFSVVNASDTHVASEWQLATDALFTNVVFQTGESATDLTFVAVPSEVFTVSTGYHWRVRYKGSTLGWSGWATSTFTTAEVFAQLIGVALVTEGGDGGTWARIDENFSAVAVDGTYFGNHPVFGGMVDEIIDGQHMVRIPKFYYKVGTVASGTYAGKSYWMISDQMVDGFAVHPAFKDAGVELDRVYVGKYQASSASSKMQSIPGVLPAVDKSLDTFRTEANARNVSGVTGFMQWTMYQLGAIQMLYLIENATMDSQTKTGMSNVNGSAALNVDNTTVAQATYRGLVGLWGNVWQWIDGFKTVSGTVNVWDTNGNKTWVSTSQPIINSGSWTYPNTFKSGNLDPLYIAHTGPTSNNNVTCTDGQYFNSGGEFFPFVGGYWNDSTNAGLWSISCSLASSDTYTSIGSRLAKV